MQHRAVTRNAPQGSLAWLPAPAPRSQQGKQGELDWHRVAKICKNDLKNINSKEMPTPAPRSQSGKQGMQRGESSGVDLQKH